MSNALKSMLTVLFVFLPAGAPYADVSIKDDFKFERADNDQPRLSPDGGYIAAATTIAAQPRARNLVTMRLSDGSVTALTGFSDTDVGNFFWANDQRLVFSTDKGSEKTNFARVYSGSYTIVRDGAGGRKVQSLRRRAAGQSGTGTPPQLLHRLPTDWNTVLITGASPASGFPAVFLLNVETGRSKKVVTNKPGITQWFADNVGNLRAAVDKGADVLDGRERLLYRDTPDSEWRQLAAYETGDLTVLAFHADNRRLIVLAPVGQDSSQHGRALYLMNADGKLVELLLSDDVFDAGNLSGGAAGLKQTSQGHLIYYQYMADGLRTVYFDPRWQNRQKIVDEALADTVNTIVDWSDDERKLLVLARVDTVSSDYYIFDTTRQALKYLQPPAKWAGTQR